MQRMKCMGRLYFKRMSKKKDEINLPKAVGNKVTFQQLRVRNENTMQYKCDVYLNNYAEK